AAAANKLKQIHFATLQNDLDPRFSSGSLLLKVKVIESLVSRSSILRVAAEAGVGSTNFLDYPWFAEKLYIEAWSTLLDGADGANVDSKLLSGTLLQHYQDFVGLTPLYLNSLYSSGLQPRSESYGFAKDMQPKKESSLSVFEQGPGASADPIWYTVNPNNEVLYSDSGAAKELIKLFVQIGQFVPSYLSFVATHVPEEKPKTLASLTETSKTLDSEAKGEQRQFEIASKFLESNGLSNLQPAQKAILKAAIKEAMAAAPVATVGTTGTQDSVDPNAAEAQIVMNALEKFTNSNDVLNRRVMNLYFADQNNFRALNTTLSILLGSF
ncbi:MAG: hypothetical protein NTX25_03275, partial [Proteobacteria bacterium]|nr:hypothetical protein [Pseudomonadota bacterium]